MTPEEFKTLQNLAETGDVRAIINLAFAYYEGDGTEQDLKQHFAWMKKAAEAGHANAMFYLALAYRDGEGTEKDLQQYSAWIKKAAEAGDADAMLTLALRITPRLARFLDNNSEAPQQYFELLKKAAEHGQKIAMRLLAIAYHEGNGTRKNHKQFFYWIKTAAEKGDKDAMHILARAYKFGEGTKPDPAQFTHWLNKAIQHDSLGAIVLERIQHLPLHYLRKVHSDLMQLSETVKSIKSLHQTGTKTSEVAHFTHYEALEKMLPIQNGNKVGQSNNHFRLYNIEYLNDPDEGRVLFQHLQKEHPELYNTLFNGLAENSKLQYFDEQVSVYTCSFSTETDRLDLWRAYGNDGDGISIVTPSNAFDAADSTHHFLVAKAHAHTTKPVNSSEIRCDAQKSPPENEQDSNAKSREEPDVPLVLYQIHYRKKEFDTTIKRLVPILKKISEYNELFINEPTNFEAIRESVRVLLSEIQFLYKNAEYENEKEVRLIYAASIHSERLHIDDKIPGHLFIKTRDIAFQNAGSKVVIGPKVKEKVATELNCKFRLARYGLLYNVTVEHSKIHYR